MGALGEDAMNRLRAKGGTKTHLSAKKKRGKGDSDKESSKGATGRSERGGAVGGMGIKIKVVESDLKLLKEGVVEPLKA
jgi:hypothetical protein